MPRVESEVGVLEQVVIHTPGAEIESMTPRTAQEVLYNDIIPLAIVRNEHSKLKAFLQSVCDVFEVADLLSDQLSDPGIAESVVRAAAEGSPAAARIDELLALDPPALAARLIRGLPSRGTTLEGVISGRQYDLKPIPNLYFMRDSSMVIGEQVVIGAMAHGVREREAQLLSTVFGSHRVLFDGVRCADPGDIRLEGGDLLVVSPDILLAGISERTSAAAVDRLADAVKAAVDHPVHLLAVVLPRERSTIHLDMVFTMVGEQTALVYEPVIGGHHSVEVYRVDLHPGRAPRIRATDGLLPALADLGRQPEVIACGGSDPVVREREQWLSAANVFAFAPEKIIAYDCNVGTLEAFSAAGFAVEPVDRFLTGTLRVDDYQRLVVAMPGVNLARGGGGPRCMTLPVRRVPLSG
mgnify:FL=1